MLNISAKLRNKLESVLDSKRMPDPLSKTALVISSSSTESALHSSSSGRDPKPDLTCQPLNPLSTADAYSGNANQSVFEWLDLLEERYLNLDDEHQDEEVVQLAIASSRGLAKQHLLNLAVRMKRETGMLNWNQIKTQFLDHTKWDPMSKNVRQRRDEDPHHFFIRCESVFRHLAYMTPEDRLRLLNGQCNRRTKQFVKYALRNNVRIESTDDWYHAVMIGKRGFEQQCCPFVALW